MNNFGKNKNETNISMVADLMNNEEQMLKKEVDEVLPILALRDMVIFPGIIMPVTIARSNSIKAVNYCLRNKRQLGVVCQLDASVEDPQLEDLYDTGVVVNIIKTLEMPDGSLTAILQGENRFRVTGLHSKKTYINAFVEKDEEKGTNVKTREFKTVMESCRQMIGEYLNLMSFKKMEISFALENLDSNYFMINFCCANLPFDTEDKMLLLKTNYLLDRAYELLKVINKARQLAELRKEIQERTQSEISQQQREYFLTQEMNNIQEELGSNGGSDSEIDEFKKLASQKKWSKEVDATFNKELNKLSRISPQNPDYNVQVNYLQTMLALPWGNVSEDNLDIKHAEKVLNKDHYGMEKVKERILEHLAVLKLRGDLKSPIICLYGPPGVGKTSLGKSIAESLKRKYVRISLGGLHDESEIRGHRRTYVGAMPGRIIKSLQKAGTSNPVFILDEIDKITQNTTNGDPASALLEVLDPAQNTTFHDNFLDVDYDLSKVMFIATANNLSTIPGPLLDRMELIEVPGYITEEKVEIARKHLSPRIKKEVGLNDHKEIKIDKSAIIKIIEDYTRESGVRELDKKINKVYRKIAFEYAKDGFFSHQTIKAPDIKELLGTEEFSRDKYQGNDYAGVVTGLAWTSVGGEILYVEVSLSKGKSGKLTLTGSLGDVMKESAMLALEYIKAHAAYYHIDSRIFDNWNIHIHVPDGSTPKDGPSAGVTLATALISALTQRKVRSNLAMTGEITLRGKVTPVGGIREKILAAKRAGITDIIMCKENKKNIDEIPELYLKGVSFHYVSDVKEVIDLALLDEKVKNPIDLTIPETEKEEKK